MLINDVWLIERSWGSLQCHMRGCTGSHGVLQWFLSGVSGSMGSYKGIQYQVRGLAGSQGTDQWSLDGSMEHVTFFGDSRNPLQYSGEGHTPQISHTGHTEKS